MLSSESEARENMKTTLKKAKEAITQKNYKGAQEYCNEVLQKDKTNYMALVMLGVSLQDSEQAMWTFEKAITLQPDKPLAWQGLATYLEKKPDMESKEKLVDVYETLIKNNPNSFNEYATKLFDISLQLNGIKSLKIFHRLSFSLQSDSEKALCKEMLIKLLLNSPKFEKIDSDFFSCLFEDIVKKENNVDVALTYLKANLEIFDLHDTIEKSLMLVRNVNIPEVDEYLCKISSEFCVRSGQEPKSELKDVYSRVLEVNPLSYHASLLKAIFLYSNGNYFESYLILCPFIDSIADKLYGAVVLLDCCIRLNSWKKANELMKFLSRQVTEDGLKQHLSVNQVVVLANQEFEPNIKEAITLGESLLNKANVECISALVKAYSDLGNYSKALELLHIIESSALYTSLKAQILRKQGHLLEAKKLLEESNEESAQHLMELTIVYWETKEYEKFLNVVRKVAYLNSFHFLPFLYLGKYYHEIEGNYLKAKKCLLKAHQMNPENEEVVFHLSKMYALTDSQNAYLDLLKTAVLKFAKQEWPHLRLGLLHMKQHNYSDAIQCFQKVIKFDATNAVVWECLSQAYYSRGSYNSALKCCQKVLSFTTSYYAEIQLGFIFIMLRHYKEALATLKALNVSLSPLKINKGLAECYVGISREYLKSHAYYYAMESAQNAISTICKAIKLKVTYASFWNILADAIRVITQLPDKYCWYNIDLGVINHDDSNEIHCQRKEDMFSMIIKCYWNSVQLQPTVSLPIYYSLATAYFEYYKVTKESTLLKKSLSLIEHCVKNDVNNYIYWNLYGTLLVYSDIKSYDLAQHAFTRSLRCKESTAAWTNLGMLYAKLEYWKLSNICFTHAQQLDPTYARSWMGQAFLAEKLQPAEVADLFRQACELGYHKESAMAFGRCIYQILEEHKCISKLSGEYALKSVPTGIDLMNWNHEYDNKNSASWTLCGLLQEKWGLLPSASNNFKAALENVKYDDDDNLTICLMNYGRILFRMGNYEGAIECFKKVSKGTIESVCGVALSLYKLQMYEQSYETYEAILEWLATDDLDKADILLAIAGIIQRLQGMSDAKPLILQSVGLTSSPSVSGLLVAASYNILHKDEDFFKIVCDEVEKRKSLIGESIFGYLFGLLYCNRFVKNDTLCDRIACLESSLTIVPKNCYLWLCLLKLCILTNDFTKVKFAAIRAMQYEKNINGSSNVALVINLVLAYRTDPVRCLHLSQKAVQERPDLVENWGYLIFSMIVCNMQSNRIKLIINNVLHSLKPSEKLEQWLKTTDSLLN